MTKNNKILLGVLIVCVFIFIGIIAGISIFIHKYSKYDMKMGESPDLYIVYGANLGSSAIPGITAPLTNTNPNTQHALDDANMKSAPSQKTKAVEGIFSLVLPDQMLTDVHFTTQSIAGLVVSKEVFDAYEENNSSGVKKVFLPSFKAAILNTKMIAMVYNSAKQSEGKKNNAYDKFEAFKKENGVAQNAAIRVAYSDLSCIDYVPVDISYEQIGKMFGLVKLSPAAGATEQKASAPLTKK